MPRSLFDPAIRSGAKVPTFKHIEEVAQSFDVSMAAAVIRMAEVDSLPVIVASYSAKGIRWRAAAPHVPRRWRLHQTLDDDSFAYDFVNGNKDQRCSGKQPAEVWFSNDEADKYEVLEQCMPGRHGEVLVLLYLTDTEMFEAAFEPSAFGRSYNGKGGYIGRAR